LKGELLVERKKVLVVDDEVHIVELVRVCLEDTDYEIIEAYDGQEALDKARSENPDLILLDVMLPKMDGYQVCRNLKSSEDTRDIPIVMLTAKGQEVDKVKGFQAGADSYMTKPFSPLRLLTELEEKLTV
jgi:two-component system, OmpR family, alkaline phosphatase synthesis response regulator PhoP